MNDKLYASIVRLEYFYKQGVVLPALPGALPEKKFTTSELELEEQVLDKVAEALLTIHGKHGAQ